MGCEGTCSHCGSCCCSGLLRTMEAELEDARAALKTAMSTEPLGSDMLNDAVRDAREACFPYQSMTRQSRLFRVVSGCVRERKANDTLSKFKSYVHFRLDTAGILTHPDGPHGKEGCRVGDRLDILVAERDAATARCAALSAALNAASTRLEHVSPGGTLATSRPGDHADNCLRCIVDALLAEIPNKCTCPFNEHNSDSNCNIKVCPCKVCHAQGQ